MGSRVGDIVGSDVGDSVGANVGSTVGDSVGLIVGFSVVFFCRVECGAFGWVCRGGAVGTNVDAG